MIDVETVAWALFIAHARERAIQTVAKPVDGEANNGAYKEEGIPSGEVVAQTRHNHAQKTKQRQVIGIDPGRHAARQPQKDLLLEWRKNALLLTRRGFERVFGHSSYFTSGWSVRRGW